MSQFTVRVELHGATSAQYETLHQLMSNAGFRRWVTGIRGDGQTGVFMLPTAEYDYQSDASAAVVRDLAKTIADRVSPGAWVLATQVADRAWITKVIHGANAA